MVGEEPKRPSWIEQNWPEYAPGRRRALPAISPLERWALSIEDIPIAARAMLLQLAEENAKSGHIRFGLRALASLTETTRNTCRRHLDGLMSAGLVRVRPLMRNASRLGYEFRLITDEDAREAAAAEGFVKHRQPTRRSADGAFVDG